MEKLIDKNFILDYSKRSIAIKNIEWGEDENSKFEFKKESISYKTYLHKVYGITSLKHEQCILKDRNGSAFLPQHCHLTVTSKDSKGLYDDVIENINIPIGERFERYRKLIDRINNADKPPPRKKKHIEKPKAKPQPQQTTDSTNENTDTTNEKKATNVDELKIEELNLTEEVDNVDFRISRTEVRVQGLQLEMPRIRFRAGPKREMISERVDQLRWSQTKGFVNKFRRLDQWRIVYLEQYQQGAGHLRRFYEEYCKRREFGPGSRYDVIAPPQLSAVRSYSSDVVRPGDQLILLLIPDGIQGSQIKAEFTKAVQDKDFPNPVPVQCLTQEHWNQRPAVLSIFEAMLAKHGNVLYEIDPVLSKDSRIKPNKTWLMGLDVSHVKGKPSVAILTICRDPLQCTVPTIHFAAHLNPSNKEIISLINFTTLVYEGLFEAVEETLKVHEGNIDALPETIWFFRDGVSDSQLKELQSKEVNGLIRALKVFHATNPNIKWKPKIEYVLSINRMLDRFGESLEGRETPHSKYGGYDDNRSQSSYGGTGTKVTDVRRPVAILNNIMSDRVFDFILYPYHPKNARGLRGTRMIILKDDNDFAKDSLYDFMQFVFALTYGYVFGIPFQNGGLAQPAPIKYSKKYAESFTQLIMQDDLKLQDLQLHKDMHRPHIVTKLLPLEDLIQPIQEEVLPKVSGKKK